MNPVFEPKYISLEYIFEKIYYFFVHILDPFSHPTIFGTVLKVVLAVFSMFFIFIITYSFVRILEVRKKEHEYWHHEIEEYRRKRAQEEMLKAQKAGSVNQRWDIVLQYLFSSSPSDWKLAILEADGMLDGLMNQLGFKGKDLGEKLKSADREKFKNLSIAWEAHIVRNKVAHEGQDFNLSHHEAKRIVALYEQIFKEYGFI